MNWTYKTIDNDVKRAPVEQKSPHLIVAMLPCEHGCIWEDHPVIWRSGTIGGPLSRPPALQGPELETAATLVISPANGDIRSLETARPARPESPGHRMSEGMNGLTGEVEHVGHYHHWL